jgi:hypothetical protein
MGWLKQASEVVQIKSLTAAAHLHMRGWEEERSLDTVHLSNLTSTDKRFCAREFAIARTEGITSGRRFLNGSLRATFDIGDAIHDLVRERWLGHLAVGNWECRSCGKLYTYQKQPARACQYCQRFTTYEYKEVTLKDPATLVVGNLDLLVDFGGAGRLTLVEVKSIDKDDFRELVAPLAEHRNRVAGYLELAARAKVPELNINTEMGIVFYASKSWGFKNPELKKQGVNDGTSPFKEYVVHRKDGSVGLDMRFDDAMQLMTYQETGVPPLHICMTPQDKRAKKCLVAQECFSAKWCKED